MPMEYRPVEEYIRTTAAIHEFTVILLSNFSEDSAPVREAIIRNFIARGLTCLESILALWSMGHYPDCWILYRSLLDRLFHLRALVDRDEFETFEKWSFGKHFEARNRVSSDPLFRSKVNEKAFAATEEDKRRYSEIEKENIRWSRPKAENIAKESFNMPFLYYYGYDHASTEVHPMATDGEEDYQRLIHNSTLKFDQRVILNNSILVQSMLIQEGLNASLFKWRGILYRFIDEVQHSLETGGENHITTLMQLIQLGPEFVWCQKE